MRDILQYFDLIVSLVENSGAQTVEIDFDQVNATGGSVEGVLYFYDGSRLEFAEVVAISRPRPVKLFYRVRAGEPVFRYDNAEHHPDVSNYPHHKHIGGKIVSAIEPMLNQVLDEVSTLLREGPDDTQPPIKRRRQRKPRRS